MTRSSVWRPRARTALLAAVVGVEAAVLGWIFFDAVRPTPAPKSCDVVPGAAVAAALPYPREITVERDGGGRSLTCRWSGAEERHDDEWVQVTVVGGSGLSARGAYRDGLRADTVEHFVRRIPDLGDGAYVFGYVEESLPVGNGRLRVGDRTVAVSVHSRQARGPREAESLAATVVRQVADGLREAS